VVAADVCERHKERCERSAWVAALTRNMPAARSNSGVACSHSPASRSRSSEGVVSLTASLYSLSASARPPMAAVLSS